MKPTEYQTMLRVTTHTTLSPIPAPIGHVEFEIKLGETGQNGTLWLEGQALLRSRVTNMQGDLVARLLIEDIDYWLVMHGFNVAVYLPEDLQPIAQANPVATECIYTHYVPSLRPYINALHQKLQQLVANFYSSDIGDHAALITKGGDLSYDYFLLTAQENTLRADSVAITRQHLDQHYNPLAFQSVSKP